MGCVKALENNGNKQIEKDKGHNNHETYKVCDGYEFVTAFLSSVFLEAVVVLGLIAVEHDGFLSCTVIHQFVPRFACCHSKQSYDGIVEVLEVCVDVDGILVLHAGEDCNSED